MGICPNCGSWLMKGYLRILWRSDSYEPDGVDMGFDKSRCDNFSPKRDEYSKKALNNLFHLDFVYGGKDIVKEFGILDSIWITLSDHLIWCLKYNHYFIVRD